MKLEARLLKVAEEISGTCHADIGTDHGHLPLYLLQHGHCQKVIAIELSRNAICGPRQLLAGYSADVREGDGFSCLSPGEVDSASLCGLGGGTIRKILTVHPERVPDKLVVQANRDSYKVRAWAHQAGFHVQREQLVQGSRLYQVLSLCRSPGPDPAYEGIPLELGVRFGPHILRARAPAFMERLEQRWNEFRAYPDTQERQLLGGAWAWLNQ